MKQFFAAFRIAQNGGTIEGLEPQDGTNIYTKKPHKLSQAKKRKLKRQTPSSKY